MIDIHAQRILVLDFGSQYTQLIARRIREIRVYCEVHPCTITDSEIQQLKPAGIILSGGPETVVHGATPRAPIAVFSVGCPVLGVCYGMQTMAVQLGGKVAPGQKREFGLAKLALCESSALLRDLEIEQSKSGIESVWMSHGDLVSELPPSFKTIANTSNCSIAAMADEQRKFYGLQFHPEVSHTLLGKQIIERFVFDICQCQANWTPLNIIETSITNIQKQVGQDTVILGLSGGVDSSVAALLLNQAIGPQLICVFVDTGLLRLNEATQVKELFAKHFKLPLQCIDAKEKFYQALRGIDDAEEKRKIVGRLFIEIFDEVANQFANLKWLAQGTIYSDVIESGNASAGTHVIKSHHNVGGLPSKMRLKLLEPLRELFKDEVRTIGKTLGLPHELLYRHPFPGPGLAIRVLGEVKAQYVEKLQQADAILIEELHAHDLYYQVSQAFAVFLPIKSVSVLGDARHYDHVIALRIVESIDFMTANFAHVPHNFLQHVANRIINEIPGISRVTYDISSKPPATIEWE